MDPKIADADASSRHLSFRTTCGRDIQVGNLILGGGLRPAQRVSLRIGASSGTESATWAGLTAAEARWLAAALLAQAAACDGPQAWARAPRDLMPISLTPIVKV